MTGGGFAAAASKRVLLERDPQVESIEALLESTRAGAGGLLIVEGWPGVGKSALLDVGKQRARERGMTVLSGQGAELERDFPFGLAMQLFEGWLARAEPTERAAALAGSAARVAGLLEGEDLSAGREDERQLLPLLHGLHWLSANLGAQNPLLLVADDGQWIDAPSLRFLLYLSQRLAELPVAVLIGFRSGQRGVQLGLLDQIETAPSARRVIIPPLGVDAATALVHGYLPNAEGEFSAACVELTGGNPLFLHELLAELRAERVEPSRAEAARVRNLVPASVSRMMLVRLARLPLATQALARALAVLGRDPSSAHAATLAGIGPEQTSEGIDQLLSNAILAESDPIEFIHPLIESSVRSETPRGERSELHRRAAELLAAAGAGPDELAPHLVHTLPAADPGVVEVLRRAAGNGLQAGAPESACRYLERALAEPPRAEQRPLLLRELGEAEAVAGITGATERIAEALGGMRSPRDRAETLLALGRLHYVEGRMAEAAEAMDRALGELEQGDAELRMQIESEYYPVASLDADRYAAAQNRAEDLIVQIGDALPLSVAARSMLASVALHLTLAAERREEALELAERAYGDGELIRQEGAEASTIYLVTGALLCAGEADRDLEVTNAAIADARRRGSVHAFATASYARGCAFLKMGRIAEAIADVEAAIDARRYGWAQFLPAAYAVLAEGLIARGELDAAVARLTELDELDEQRWAQTVMGGIVLGVRGMLAAAQGKSELALESFLEQGERMPWANPAMFAAWRSNAALAAARLGRTAQAQELAREELEVARRWGAPGVTGVAQRALGVALGGDEGIEMLAEAVETLRTAPEALDRWNAQIELGAALRRAGRRTEAREPLRQAADEAARLGAAGVAERASQELALTGARRRSSDLSGVESLTPGELRVAKLAAESMTNRQIAEALFVTPKAVQWHLRNTYRKLELEGRAELAEALQR